MNVMLSLLVPALVGVDYGWHQKPDGTIAYLVQVDAVTFAEMQRTGQAIGSALPAHVRSRVSDFSFRVGSDPLPNQNTLPPEETAATNSTRVTVNYPPTNEIPGASTAPAGSTVVMPQPTTYHWGGAPTTPPSVSIPQTAPPPGSQSWAQNTLPASSATTQPLSTSGFPINPTAAPPGTSGVYPNSTTSASGAYPTNTAPPSLNNGPRISQPQPWQTPPREVTISARTPLEPNPPLTAANPNAATGPNLNPPPATIPAGYATSTPPGYAANGYPTNPPQYAANPYPPNSTPAPQPNYAAAPPPQDPYYHQRQAAQPPREPASASNNPPPQTTTNTAAGNVDRDWLPLTLVLIGFLTSLAANFYFGWSTYQLRERCRMLLTDRGAF